MTDSVFDFQGHTNVTDMMLETCAQYPHKTAFSCMGQNLTFAELDQYSQQFASYLQQHTNLQPGDRIALKMPNILQYAVAILAALRSGMVIVNTNPLYTPRELEHQLKDSGAKVLVVYAGMANVVEQVIDRTDVEQVIVTEIADMHRPIKGFIVNAIVKHVKKMVPAFNLPGAITFKQALALGKQHTVQPFAAQLEGTVALQYTGGTTGVSKGAVLLHSNIVANLLQLTPLVQATATSDNEIIVMPLPLYHIFAFTVSIGMARLGHHTVLVPNPRDLKSLVKEMSTVKFTAFAGLNTLFNGLCQYADFKTLDFSHLTTTISGGMALTHTAADQWKAVTGCVIQEGYGLTETAPAVSFNEAHNIHVGSIGTVVLGTEVKVVDEQGNTLANGSEGELLVRGPQVMAGYWNAPEATAQAIDSDGWFKTGDIATINDEGIIHLVDRIKDMIIVSGFNVYPNEIDNVMSAHPDILECASVGVPSDATGEAVKLYVVAKDSSLTQDGVIEFARQHLTAYKVPKLIAFHDELPKTPVGKILRRALTELD